MDLTHHIDSRWKEAGRFDGLFLLLYLGLQLGGTDLVLGEQHGGRKLRMLLEGQMGFYDNVNLGVFHATKCFIGNCSSYHLKLVCISFHPHRTHTIIRLGWFWATLLIVIVWHCRGRYVKYTAPSSSPLKAKSKVEHFNVSGGALPSAGV